MVLKYKRTLAFNLYLGFKQKFIFKAPEPADGWEGTLDARHYGRACPVSLGPQSMDSNYKNYPTAGFEEDCLNINVYTPSVNTIFSPYLKNL